MTRHCLAMVLGFWLVGTASAATWADGLFTDLNKDFGTVPRGPTLSHQFLIKNTTGQPVHISGVRVSCGCVKAMVPQAQLAPGQEAALFITMDTGKFSGTKLVTVLVGFDQPRSEEVQLWVRANSRDDVTVTPDAFAFGSVKRGSQPALAVNIAFLGSSGWRVEGIHCESNYVRTSLQEVKRDRYETAYKVTAQLRADAPVGKWYTDVWVRTNNPSTPRVRVPLTVEIESLLSVSPNLVDLGKVKAGGSVERKVIVRGVQPFRITAIEGGDEQLTVKPASVESRLIHVLGVTLKPTTPGSLLKPIKVVTDLAEEAAIEFQTRAEITP